MPTANCLLPTGLYHFRPDNLRAHRTGLFKRLPQHLVPVIEPEPELGAIRERRRAIGLSQEDLAELIDCHRNYVGTVERGEQNVTFDLLMRFAKALETSLGTIINSAKL